MLVIVYYLIFRLYLSKAIFQKPLWEWLLESNAETLDNKQSLTSILFIPKMFKLLVILFLIKLFARKDIFSRVPFKQLELSILLPLQWKLILKTAARASVMGSPFSTAIGKISTFYSILLSTTFYTLMMKILSYTLVCSKK